MKQWCQPHTLYNSQLENQPLTQQGQVLKDGGPSLMGLIRTGFKLDDTALKSHHQWFLTTNYTV